MSAGTGYRYLLKSVVVGDGNRSLSDPMTRYYLEEGTPAGRWLGAGLPDLAGGLIVVGDVVSESQLKLLVGEGRDPITGVPLGRPYRVFVSEGDRIAARVAALDPELSGAERAGAVARIEGEEAGRGSRRAVAGFDFTFSVPKSASVLWAVGDARVRGAVEDAHRNAVADVLAVMERKVAATRVGASDGSGAVVQADVTGLIATAFDHFDSRAGDPHLHTHVVIANRARTAADGIWRSLDGRPMHAAAVALSELHEAVFADRLTGLLGVEWEARTQGRDRNPSWAIASVPEGLVKVFSSRSQDIDMETDALIAQYVTAHGHRPTPAVVMRLRQRATLSTRPEKQIRSLSDLTVEWRARAEAVLGSDPVAWAAAAVQASAGNSLQERDVPAELVERWGAHVVGVVGEKRSTWRHWNLLAETARQTMGWRFATPADREAVTEAITAAAERASVTLSPPELASTPALFRRGDGSSRFRPRYSTVFSAAEVMAAESRLLGHARDLAGPSVPRVIVDAFTSRKDRGWRLGADQVGAVTAVAVSGRVVDVLVGPAGAGKTTAMRALRRVWEAGHGTGSVVGLAPSAAAAEVLAVDLEIATENTAKWLHDQRAGTASPLRRGQLVIIDEASLADTSSLDQIVGAASEAGAKVLLVGDHAQLQAVDAGGAFAMLTRDRDDVPELTDVRRFHAEWEKTASLQLRTGDAAVVNTYAAHGRVVGGDLDTLVTRAFDAWRADVHAGRVSVLIADTSVTVRALNLRARADGISSRAVDPVRSVRLHDGSAASRGDVIVTRRNDRQLLVGRTGWVRNGDRWTVQRTEQDGTVVARRVGRRWGATVRLPADYAAAEVELGYAVTTHRAQGISVDTGHTIITAGATREAAYVGMTRGRACNTAYVALDQPDELESAPHPSGLSGEEQVLAARSVLADVLARTGAERSAHDTLRHEQDVAASVRVLAAEYDTIATAAQHDRWVAAVHASCLTRDQADAVVASGAFGALGHVLRRAEAARHDPEALLARIVATRPLDDAADVAAVLTARLEYIMDRRESRWQPEATSLIVGLIPEAAGPMTPEMAEALQQRRNLIEQRVEALVHTAAQDQPAWVPESRPTEARAAASWDRNIRIVAAYRDLHGIGSSSPTGDPVGSRNQQRDLDRTIATIRAEQLEPTPAARPAPRVQTPALERHGLGRTL